MNTFKVARLGIWGVILATCLSVAGLYLAVHQTFLVGDSLQHIVKESRIAETVREEVLLPKILQTTRASDYSSLLDGQTVTDAFNEAVSTETLNAKLKPAALAIQKWLNSEEPEVSFSINMTDLSDSFANTLSKKVQSKVAALPACTLRNSLSDAQSGTCKSSLVTPEALAERINTLIANDSTLASNTTITPATLNLPTSSGAASDIPSYLNLFYALSLVALGITVVVSLWLLLKHRLSGIVTIGAGALLAGMGMFLVSVVGPQRLGIVSSDSQVQQVLRAGSSGLEANLQQLSVTLGVVGLVLIVGGAIGLLIIKKRFQSSQSIHFSRH